MLSAITEQLLAVPSVDKVHHLHFWSLDGELHVLSAHLRMMSDYDPRQQMLIKREIADQIADFNLAHTTFEFELADEPARDLIEPWRSATSGRECLVEKMQHNAFWNKLIAIKYILLSQRFPRSCLL